MFAEYLFLFSPVYFSVDPEPPVVQEYSYVPKDQYPSAELPGKQPLLDHSEITYSLSLVLALDFAITVIAVAPISDA